jgi:integrase
MKIGHVEITVQQYADGRWGFDDYSLGQRRMVRVQSRQKAQSRATDIAVLLANGRNDLLGIDQNELAEFRKWQAASNVSMEFKEAREAFLALKAGKSSRHRQSLEHDLKLFEAFIGSDRSLGTIMALDIQRFLSSRNVGDRRKYNLRAGIVALFRWARRMSYLPDRTTEAEKVEPIQKTPGQPNILSPDQMRVLLDNVREELLPWLVIAGFAGVRSQEIAPDYRSRKSPLAWEDFDWRHKTIIVRAQTAKTKEEREVPITPNLAEWLAPWRRATGPVCLLRPCNHETRRLGHFIGGWKHNALRDSFCSYRTRITQNVPQVSYEMGNSIWMVKRSYHRRQPIRAAKEWFNIRPEKSSKVVSFPKSTKKYQIKPLNSALSAHQLNRIT